MEINVTNVVEGYFIQQVVLAITSLYNNRISRIPVLVNYFNNRLVNI